MAAQLVRMSRKVRLGGDLGITETLAAGHSGEAAIQVSGKTQIASTRCFPLCTPSRLRR
jgi:hypothetical protein